MQTGLDLVDFPTIAGFEPDYPVSTMRQAWPVKVVFMAYRNNLQADTLKPVGQEAPVVPGSGRSKSSTSPAGSARSPPATGPRPVPFRIGHLMLKAPP